MPPDAASHERHVTPMKAGGALALASAVAFGATTPLVQQFGRGAGPFVTAALLYGGAAGFAALAGARARAAEPVRPTDAPRLAVVALLGAVVAPVALAWGLQRTSGVMASLLLNLEALFTALLARVLWAEPIGRRAAVALAMMTAGGALLVANPGGAFAGAGPVVGGLAVVVATFAWAADNALGRPLADRDPARVVLGKAALGAAASAGIALVLREPWPAWGAALALAACGAIGFGASLTLYLRAQRLIGAARTGSIFAAAPFVGAAIAWTLAGAGAAAPSAFTATAAVTLVACVLLAVGVWLHLTESHGHEHTHDALQHSHAHRHDDRHHDHAHDVYPPGPHAHAHSHEKTSHVHPHGLDLHHRHRH